jgi:hypothetical protein
VKSFLSLKMEDDETREHIQQLVKYADCGQCVGEHV